MTARAKQAAVFDLDRTLLPGGSGPAITAALAGVGLVAPWQVGLANATFGIYDRMGETRLSMQLARRAVDRSAGWDCEQVSAAATAAAEVLDGKILPRARLLIEEHREAGRPVVLATTTAVPLVAPLAAALGITDLVATRWHQEDGHFTGRLDGPFVWGPAKLDAVAAWCSSNDVDLSTSYAYSDSIYDLPLLDAAGHPHATNPDARLRALAIVRRWPVLDLTIPVGIPSVAGYELLDAALPLLRPQAFPFARWRFEGLEHIPEIGPAVLEVTGGSGGASPEAMPGAERRAPPRRERAASPLDLVAVAMAGARRGRKVRFHGDSGMLAIPLLGRLLGTAPTEDDTARALAAGEVVAVPSLPATRLAAAAGAPLVPVTVDGTDDLWPPRPRRNRPTITVIALSPH